MRPAMASFAACRRFICRRPIFSLAVRRDLLPNISGNAASAGVGPFAMLGCQVQSFSAKTASEAYGRRAELYEDDVFVPIDEPSAAPRYRYSSSSVFVHTPEKFPLTASASSQFGGLELNMAKHVGNNQEGNASAAADLLMPQTPTER